MMTVIKVLTVLSFLLCLASFCAIVTINPIFHATPIIALRSIINVMVGLSLFAAWQSNS